MSDEPLQTQHARLHHIRHTFIEAYRPILQNASEPVIRIMARLIKEIQHECRAQHIDASIIQTDIIDRTMGDINLRLITECVGEKGGKDDYRLLADELGIALPDELLHGNKATGETYLWLRTQMMECERLLLEQNSDLRLYDILAVGNPILRTWLAQDMQQWGLSVTPAQLYLGLGSMDCIDKVLRGLAHISRMQHISPGSILFPTPGFKTPEWQASSHGYNVVHFATSAIHQFKLMAEELQVILQTQTDIRLIYLTITNNPTTFAYTAEELQAIYAVLAPYRETGRRILVLTDLAYLGTGKPEDDQARMSIFHDLEILQQTIFVSSFSKTYTLTGDRFGWVTFGDQTIAAALAIIWANSQSSLPAEWQLRFMAYMRLFQQRPWLADKLRRLYHFRRMHLIKQLRQLDNQFHLFQQIYLDDDATIYNWSQLQPHVDCFSLFEKTGIAGIPGSAFGYSDDFIRFSVGIYPVESSAQEIK